MTTEAQALFYLRSNLRTPNEIIVCLNAMCASQDGAIAQHLAVCADRISESIPDEEPEDATPNGGNPGQFDLQSGAKPAWATVPGFLRGAL